MSTRCRCALAPLIGPIVLAVAFSVIAVPSAASAGPRVNRASEHAAYTCKGPAITLFDNWNTGGVGNGGAQPSFSTKGKSYCVSWIFDYHWNNGQGKAPGTIGLMSAAGKRLGPWKAVGSAGSGVNNDGMPSQTFWSNSSNDAS